MSLTGIEKWFRLYLSTLVLVPLGIVCIIIGAGMTADRNQVAATLIVLGAGMLVFGGFGPRMEGPFKFGPTGAEGGLSPAERQIVVNAARKRLTEAQAKGLVQPFETPLLEGAIVDAAEKVAPATPSRRRGYRARPTVIPPDAATAELERLGEALADAVIAVAKEPTSRK